MITSSPFYSIMVRAYVVLCFEFKILVFKILVQFLFPDCPCYCPDTVCSMHVCTWPRVTQITREDFWEGKLYKKLQLSECVECTIQSMAVGYVDGRGMIV